MKKHYTLFICLFIYRIVFSQTAPEIEWQNTIGGSGNDLLYSIDQVTDGGYIVGGYSISSISGDKTEPSMGGFDYWVLKLNSSGSIEWQNTIGGNSEDFLYSIKETTDGGYILGGSSISGISGDKTEPSYNSIYEDYWVIKLNSSGLIEWQNTIGGNFTDKLLSVDETSDGGYILGGYSNSDLSGDKIEGNLGSFDYWIVKLNLFGEIEWQNTLGGSNDDLLQSVQQTADGGYILGGYSLSGVSGDKIEPNIGGGDYWVIKLSSLGIIEWQNTIGGDAGEYFSSITQTVDAGYILGGWSFSGISGDKTEINKGLDDYWVVKLNSLGSIEWQNTIGGASFDDLFSVSTTIDNGYILGGRSFSGISGDKNENNTGDYDYWFMKLDTFGNMEWQNTVGGLKYDYLISVKQTNDEGFILGGYSFSGISGDKTETSNGLNDYWVIKLYPDDFCAITSSIIPTTSTSFCAGENVTLNAPIDASYTYQWKKNGVNISGATTSSFTANNTGQYQVFISNGTCDDISDSLFVIKNPKPNPTITNVDATNDLCFDSAIKLKTAAVAGSSYQWYKGAVAISGATTNVYLATMPGNYKVKVTNSAGCFKLSSPYMIIKTCKLGDEESVNDITVSIYPNPNNGTFTLELNTAEDELISISIKNLIGEEIYSERAQNSDYTYSIKLDNNIPGGLYAVEIKTPDQILSQQIVIFR